MITLGPATTHGSVVYAGEAVHPVTRRHVHVLGFQARLTNASRRPNAVVLPVPAASPIDVANLVDVPPGALDEFAGALRQMDPNRGFERPDTRVLPRGKASLTFTRPDAVVRALEAVPAERRPPVDRAFFRRVAEWYPGAQLVLCCWDGTLHADAVVLWYEPIAPDPLFLPSLVAAGGEPSPRVVQDQALIVGSTIRPFGTRVGAAPVTPLLPPTVWGKLLKGEQPNADHDVAVGQLHELRNVAGKHDMHARLDPKLWSLRFEPRVPR